MAVISTLIREKNESINLRSGEVIGDVIIENDYFQLRTYAKNDHYRENGSKQNVQFDITIAREFRDMLNEFLNES